MHLADLARHDLNALVTLHALLDSRSVTRAAQRLNLSQPAVSRTLSRLRQAFDDPLFVRTHRGLRPTARAQALGPPLSRLLEELGALLAPPEFDPASTTRRFHIATTDYGMHAFLAPQWQTVKHQAPHMRLDVQSGSGEVEQQLDEGGPELALCVPGERVPASVHGREVGHDHFVCVMREDHPLALQPEADFTLEAFLHADHQLISMGGDDRGAVDLALAKRGLKRRVSLRQPHFLAGFSATQHSDLLLCVPGCLAASVADHWPLALRRLPLAVPSFAYWLVWHERHHADAGHRWLRHALFDGLKARHRTLSQRPGLPV
ncbi:LysR family transcriptional regulator [Vreelandella subglaciescola]|uniref:DNA-binding transcriptional regulator, LysR family n=1 Tax=Vreelandella subglaciescola TaxID=29571 RepID=A0A1M7HHI9_9GAMM|nr:LysR family transcriptional regulator [Halomonas subglaciescola]SHM28001.1 DNA-binding transcriptional regulator, LysR family [Halomonas subglaciescola]